MSILALLVVAELGLALVHAVWAAMSLRLVGSAQWLGAAMSEGKVGGIALLAAGVYVVIWAPLGGLCALAAAWGLHRRRVWGRRLSLLHAMLSLPCPVLLPLGAYVLYALTRPAVRACWVRHGAH